MFTLKFDDVTSNVLKKIRPTLTERAEQEELTKRLLKDINLILSEAGLDAEAEVHGSIAHDTWISGEQDLDIFIVCEQTVPRKGFNQILDLVKDYLGEGWREAYAEHPYIQAEVDGYRVDFVPCYRIIQDGVLKSSTDRSPLHSEYLREKLTPSLKDEVRLLKQFIRGIGFYGAEIRIGGFSGYLCELLIIGFGGYKQLLEAACNWKPREVVKISGKENAGDLRKKFDDPIILMDPVDSNRNVASALREEALWSFVSASSMFLKDPSESYFFETERSFSKETIIEVIKERKSDLIFMFVNDGVASVPDILWGQLRKTENAIVKVLNSGDFNVLRSEVWSDEEFRHVFLFELESVKLGGLVKLEGPPAYMKTNVESFIRSHRADKIVSGPFIEGERWYIITERKYTDALDYLKSKLIDGGIGVGVSKDIANLIKEGYSLLVNEEVENELYGDLPGFLIRFLDGRPVWLG